MAAASIHLSFVIPVYNGADSIARVVDDIVALYSGRFAIEIVLINDGSRDQSESVCAGLVASHPRTVKLVQLAKNFGEHAAVMAGLARAHGQYIAILDDDGQNPPREVAKLLAAISNGHHDVVYSRYDDKRHHWGRNFGSWFNDRCAVVLLGKPDDLYLSSFKIMSAFLAREICKYAGPFPYIDGLILRATRNIGQVVVEHADRASGRSNYTLRKLIGLWLNAFCNFSIWPLRMASVCGLVISAVSVAAIFLIVLDKLWFGSAIPHGIPTVLSAIMFLAGVQLLMLGMIGEYLGRIFLSISATPQYVVRYAKGFETGV